MSAPACDYRMRAGDQAVSRSAYPEAVAHFSAGLKLAEALPTQDGMRRQLDFLLKLGSASVVAHGLQSVEVEDAYTRASEIGEKLGDGTRLFQAKWGLWINANLRRKTALARDRASELVTLAQRSGDGELLLEAYHCRWSTAFFRGDVSDALDSCRIGVEMYDMDRHRHLGHAIRRSRSGRLRAFAGRQRLSAGGRSAKGNPKFRAGARPRGNARPSQ